ncbi:NAD(P)-dependent dehydrogenase, short-chain alcohol dehydrogenase family [Novosphingobium sp. CF614]|uniref:SDR family NAD(P)-dependent oxidoreductase n=1 Tax=Novosphingobium sp. CF614 TaxID=1884364 RepID=UPI0008F15259|nr:SDR family NAD(P)-dependent oxidoreductase [Novosphingobium sp. CF614]SFF79550.1 NAD(P)-dependent dehydrogenase, short-chain alcohol dehydrogenase family [Novosphingobium sp. CF614]
MDRLRFDGQVAIVTGAGGNPGLGRAHAMLLAERGARVVVNDLSKEPLGSDRVPASAEAVAAEIVAAGGEAVADTHSVADEASAAAVVQTALDRWGRIDILVNNAGVGFLAGFDEITSVDIRTMVEVHLMGAIWMSRAVWKPMQAAGYGRIVNTTSGGMMGMNGMTVYGAAKFGIFGLTRGLAVEGASRGIKVNALSPGAATRNGSRHFTIPDPEKRRAYEHDFRPALVSPAVAYLAHEACEVSGMLFHAGGGKVSSRQICMTTGIDEPDLTIEQVRDGLDTILDPATLTPATDPRDPSVTGNSTAAALLVPKAYEPG